MNIEDIKIGETYLLPVTVTTIEKSRWIEVATCNDYEYRLAPSEVKTLSPETAPKYDPCREFKKGDIVEPRKGREVYACEWEDRCFHKMDGKYEVQEDEKKGLVSVIDKETGIECYVSAFALELVTPVEELDPYVVRLATPDGVEEWHVEPRNNPLALVAVFGHRHPHAKAAAEAERDRLNAEYRKEKK